MVGGVAAVAVGRAALVEEAIETDETDARLALAVGGRSAVSVCGGRASGCSDRGGRGAGGAGTGRSWGRITVPVGLGVVEALSDGDTTEVVVLEVLDHVDGEVYGAQLVDVVGDGKLVTVSTHDLRVIALVNAILEVVLRVLDELRGQVQVVYSLLAMQKSILNVKPTSGVQIEVGDNITKLGQNVLAGVSAGRVRWAHVSWVFAENVSNGHLVLDHLVIDLLLSNGAEVLVRPGVTGDLVALVVHLLDDTRPVLVDSTLANVVTSKEESSVKSGILEELEYSLSVDVWSIIIGDGHSAGVLATVDTSAAIRNVSKLWAKIIAGRCSIGSFVSIASRTKVELAVRGGAVSSGSSAVTLVIVSIRAFEIGGQTNLRRAALVCCADLVVSLCTAAFRVGFLAGLHFMGMLSSIANLVTSEGVSRPQILWQTKESGGSFNSSVSRNKRCHQRGGNNVGETHLEWYEV